MVNRRKLLSGGLIAGASAAFAGEAAARTQQRDDDVNNRIAKAVDDLRQSLETIAQVAPELTRIREVQRVFLKANRKFPDVIEVGISVWESVHDWHIRHQFPLRMSRTNDGRYTMALMFSTLVLRSDQADSYVGFGYDAP